MSEHLNKNFPLMKHFRLRPKFYDDSQAGHCEHKLNEELNYEIFNNIFFLTMDLKTLN